MSIPWRKIKSQIIHKNPYYYITEDDVIMPDGQSGKYYVINVNNSVMIIAEDKRGDIFLVGQTRYPIGGRYSWEAPGGSIEIGQTPLQAAKRELKEETGLAAKSWRALGYFHPETGLNSEKCFVFLAKNLINGQANHEATEDITVKKFKLAKIIEMINHNQITDGFALSAIIKYLVYKKKF